MEIVAQVFDWMITKTELDFEEKLIRHQYPDAEPTEIRAFAISQLVDRYLLMQEAINRGICINDEEFEDAMFDMIDCLETPETSVLVNRLDRGEQIERVLKSNLYIRKYLESINAVDNIITDNKLYQFYQDRKDFFFKEEEVRASHILMKGTDQQTYEKMLKIRDCINCASDFAQVSLCNSECPSGMNCGDLGYFPRGRMIKEIEQVAFSLQVNEISQPFKTRYGYHILMVTDKKGKQSIPFEQIKDCLKESLIDIEEEIAVNRILADLRKRCQNNIQIFDHAFQ